MLIRTQTRSRQLVVGHDAQLEFEIFGLTSHRNNLIWLETELQFINVISNRTNSAQDYLDNQSIQISIKQFQTRYDMK